jgi:hypothetical protein
MKNKKQVIAYLQLVNIVSEKDELAIESYLVRQNIIINLSRYKKTDSGSMPNITFEQFREWFIPDLPDRNEVVVIEDSGLTGITQCFCVDEIMLGVSLSEEGKLTANLVKIADTTYRKASMDEKIRLQKAINREGLSWNLARSKLIEAHVPAGSQVLRVSLLGEKIAIGVFREINDEGKIVMYCVKENGKPVRYSLYEPVADKDEYQLEPVSVQERTLLAKELEKVGKVWNGFAKRIEPVNLRVEKGEIYFFIDDFLTITATTERNVPKDLKRLRSGNYYRNRSDAEEMLTVVNCHRKKQLVDFIHNKDAKKTLIKKRSKNFK